MHSMAGLSQLECQVAGTLGQGRPPQEVDGHARPPEHLDQAGLEGILLGRRGSGGIHEVHDSHLETGLSIGADEGPPGYPARERSAGYGAAVLLVVRETSPTEASLDRALWQVSGGSCRSRHESRLGFGLAELLSDHPAAPQNATSAPET